MSYARLNHASFFRNFHDNVFGVFHFFPGFLILLILLIAFPAAGYASPAQAIKATLDSRLAELGFSEPAAAAPARWVKGRLLVIPRAGLSTTEFNKAAKPYGIKSKRRLKGLNAHLYELPEGVDELKVLERFRKDRRFKAVELDRLVEPAQTVTDPAFKNSWALPKIQAPSAWNIATGNGVTIAILDTGVDSNHPDLAANIIPGWNAYDNNTDTRDIHGHGTRVAGSAAAAANNGIGSAGVAWDAQIMPVRIARPDGLAYLSTMAQAIRWAADNGARVVNISYGGAESATVQSAANYARSKGSVVVMSAGNTGGLNNYPPSNAIIVVAATDSNDKRAGWSSYGPYVDVAAPGVSIYTTSRGGGYGYASGTSFSSPIVAATAALIFSANPDLTPVDIDHILTATALDLGSPGHDNYYGHGRINAAGAVEAAYARISVDNMPPVVSITSPIGGEVSGSVPVDVNYSDNQAVVRVELHVNGKKAIEDTQPPFAFAWDTVPLADGSYTLTAYAFDAAGNQSTSSSVTVTVKNADKNTSGENSPEIIEFNLSNGQKVRRNENVKVTASPDTRRIDLKVNGHAIAASNGNSLNYRWNTWDSAPRGSTLTVTVEAANADRDTVSKTVTVRN